MDPPQFSDAYYRRWLRLGCRLAIGRVQPSITLRPKSGQPASEERASRAREGTRALIMELVEGRTLAKVIAATGARGLPAADALSIGRQIAEALDVAHEKDIVHRDLKACATSAMRGRKSKRRPRSTPRRSVRRSQRWRLIGGVSLPGPGAPARVGARGPRGNRPLSSDACSNSVSPRFGSRSSFLRRRAR